MEMKLLILKILNHKIQEVKKIPLQYQAIIFSKMMQEDLNEEQYCRSYAFLIDESNKANVMGQEAAKTVDLLLRVLANSYIPPLPIILRIID